MTCTILFDILTREACKKYGYYSGETENTRQTEEIIYILILLFTLYKQCNIQKSKGSYTPNL